MGEGMSSLSLTVSYASFIFDSIEDHIPPQHLPVSMYIIIGALTAWSEMVMHQTRDISNCIISVISEADPEHFSISGVTNIMQLAADTIGKALFADSPKNCFPVFASTLMALLEINPNIEIHLQISTLLSSFTKAWVDSHPTSPQ